MKAVILAGGFGTRLGEESLLKPKPMVEIGGFPILWHILKHFAFYGVREFILCCGRHGNIIQDFFTGPKVASVSRSCGESWRVHVEDTGEYTMTGGRLKRIRHLLGEEDFFMTYGDGLGNINIEQLRNFHQAQGTLATVTAVRPPARFGALELLGPKVKAFTEHAVGESGWINGGFFVLAPEVLELISGDETAWELEPMSRLVQAGQLSAFCHHGFWQPMDTLRDKNKLEELWASGGAPWKVWR